MSNDTSNSDNALRAAGGKWKKGGPSPNPSGRPRVLRDVVEKAREYTVESIETLARIMRDEDQPGATRVAAADKILDRGYGKPTQFVGIDDPIDDAGMFDPERMSTRELAMLVRRRLIRSGASEAEAMMATGSPDDDLPAPTTGSPHTVQ